MKRLYRKLNQSRRNYWYALRTGNKRRVFYWRKWYNHYTLVISSTYT